MVIGLLALASCQTDLERALSLPTLIDAQIDWSEWDPPILVRLDVRTGIYSLVAFPGARRTPQPDFVRGRLSSTELQALRQASQTAWTAGLVDLHCKGEIIISNAGPIKLSLTRGNRRLSSPRELWCWSPQANALQVMLSERFWPTRREAP